MWEEAEYEKEFSTRNEWINRIDLKFYEVCFVPMNKTIFFVWGVVLIVFIFQNGNLYKFVESLGDSAFFLSKLY